MLVLRHLTITAQDRLSLRPQRVVQHALHDDRARGIVRAGFRTQTQKSDSPGVDFVIFDQSINSRRRHCVRILCRPDHAETLAHDVGNLGPRIAGPLAPRLEVHPVRRDVLRKSADSYSYGFHYYIRLRRLHSPVPAAG